MAAGLHSLACDTIKPASSHLKISHKHSELKTLTVYKHNGVLYRSIVTIQKVQIRTLLKCLDLSEDIMAKLVDVLPHVLDQLTDIPASLVYQTSDGKYFENYEYATIHEYTLEQVGDASKSAEVEEIL